MILLVSLHAAGNDVQDVVGRITRLRLDAGKHMVAQEPPARTAIFKIAIRDEFHWIVRRRFF